MEHFLSPVSKIEIIIPVFEDTWDRVEGRGPSLAPDHPQRLTGPSPRWLSFHPWMLLRLVCVVGCGAGLR